MKNNTRLYDFLTILVMGLFCYYTYIRIISLGYGESSNIGSIIKLSVVGISVLASLISGSNAHTKFTRFWLFWIIWLLIDFFVLGLRGEGVSNIFSVTFAPFSFLFFFTVGSFSENATKIATVGFLALFCLLFLVYHQFVSLLMKKFHLSSLNLKKQLSLISNCIFLKIPPCAQVGVFDVLCARCPQGVAMIFESR